MRESVTYMEILEEGIEQGIEQGRADEARRLLLLFGGARFGPPDDAVRRFLDETTDPEALERLAERMLMASSWQELLTAAE